MFTQFFGNYLLNEGLVTPQQLIDGLQLKNETRMKLGVLAINAGYMTASQVERVHERQSKVDKRFGDIAVEFGYLTEEKVMELLQAQPVGYLLLGQALVDQGALTNTQFEDAIRSYKEKYSLTDEDIATNENTKTDTFINSLYDFSTTAQPDMYKEFISLLINNLIRFVGDDFTPMQPITDLDSSDLLFVRQDVTGSFSTHTLVMAAPAQMIEFATRYAGEEITEVDEYTEASAQDFLNLNNGLFLVNVSNNQQVELKLTPPTPLVSVTADEYQNSIILPFQYPFGIIYLVVTM